MSHYYFPAEWEPQSGVLLTMPHEGTDWKPYLREITVTYRELAEAISAHESLVEVTAGIIPSNDTWARDFGPITLIDGQGGIRLLDFQFNGWGRKYPAGKDNTITRNLYRQGAFHGELIDYNDFVLEGGSIESDGKGTIMTTSSCLLAPNRNQPMTKSDIERELLNRLYAKRVIWIDHGRLIGDDTDGHIDTIVRFAPDDTLLYIGCDDNDDPQYEDFRLLENQLRGLRTMEGKPYRLIRLPFPQPIYYDGERLPATYANFLVINGAVIVPTYNQPSTDSEAMRLIGSAFPSREVIGIDATVIIRQHGSIHCLTMQLPEGAIA